MADQVLHAAADHPDYQRMVEVSQHLAQFPDGLAALRSVCSLELATGAARERVVSLLPEIEWRIKVDLRQGLADVAFDGFLVGVLLQRVDGPDDARLRTALEVVPGLYGHDEGARANYARYTSVSGFVPALTLNDAVQGDRLRDADDVLDIATLGWLEGLLSGAVFEKLGGHREWSGS